METLTLTAAECVGLEHLLRSPGSREYRRAQALLWLAEGTSVEEVADRLGVSRQTVYNWSGRFRLREDGDLLGRLADAPRSGRPPTGKGVIEPLVAAVIDDSPRDYGLRAVTWTAPLLCQYLRRHHGVAVSRRTVSRAIDRLGIRWKRPRHDLALRPDTWRQAKGGSGAGSGAARAPCC